MKLTMQMILTTAILAIAAAFAAGVVSAEDDSRTDDDRWSIHYGFAEFLTGPGELGYCPSTGTPRDRFVIRSTYARLPGVCDDLGERKCDGRLLRVVESCVADWAEYRVDGTPSYFSEVHFLRLAYAKARVRICYSEDGMCSDVDEVARGHLLTKANNRFFQNPPVDGPTNFDFSQTYESRETITHAKPFRLDRKRARVAKGASSGSSASRFNLNCIIANNCPIEGSLLMDR